MTTSPPTSLRLQLWSPVQNTALWFGWWVYDLISTDALITALGEVQGSLHRYLPPVPSPLDAPAPSSTASLADAGSASPTFGSPEPLISLLRDLRAVVSEAPLGVEHRPWVSLALAGPGDVPPLPAGSAAAAATGAAGSAIVLADPDPLRHHAIVPTLGDGGEVWWHWYPATGRCPALPSYSPGEADFALREAMDAAASVITDAQAQGRSGTLRHRAPHLAVGALSDAFALPGLPPEVPHRAAALMARADTAAAIVDTIHAQELGPHYDAALLPVLRAVRQARMVAVDYAMREVLR